MILFDVNVLVYAHRLDSLNHSAYSTWLERLLNAEEPFGAADLVLSGFLRIVTNRKVFRFPTPSEEAMAFVEDIRNQPNCLNVVSGPRHWSIFRRLCKEVQATGNAVPDSFLAALAIESGCEWITTDRGFRHFPGLRWRHPLGEGHPLAEFASQIADLLLYQELDRSAGRDEIGVRFAGATSCRRSRLLYRTGEPGTLP